MKTAILKIELLVTLVGFGWPRVDAYAGVLPLHCGMSVAMQGHVLLLGAKKAGGGAQQINSFVEAYQGILADSREFLSLESLSEAYENETPFAIRGDGALFLQTQEALLSLQHALESLPPELRQTIEGRLRESLQDFSPKQIQQKRIDQSTRQQKTGTAPPFSLIYELPQAFPTIATAGSYTADGKYLVTLDSSGSVRTYSTRTSTRRLVYSTPPFAGDGLGWDTRNAALKRSPLVIRPGDKQFAFLLSGSGENAGPYLLDVATGKLSKEFAKAEGRGPDVPDASSGRRLVFSADGRFLGIGARTGGDYRTVEALWDLEKDFIPVGQFARFAGGVSSGFSPDGRYYLNCSGGLHIYDVKNEHEVLNLLPKGETENDRDNRRRGIDFTDEFAIHPTAPVVALQDFVDGAVAIRLYDYSRLPSSYIDEYAELEASTWNQDFGTRPVRYVKKPLKMRVFHTQKKKGWSQARGNGVLFSPDGKFLISHAIDQESQTPRRSGQSTVPESSLVVFKTADLSKPGRIYKDLSAFISWRLSKMLFTSDGSHLLVLDYWGRLSAFRLPDFKLIASVGSAQAPIWDFEISPDSRRIFTLEEMGKPRERNFLPE